MFTAKDARDLTESTSNQARPILAEIDEKVKKAAAGGNCSYTSYVDGTWEAYPHYVYNPGQTKLQEFIVDDLIKRGFKATFEKDGG